MKVLILGGPNSRSSGGVFNTARALGLHLSEYCKVDIHYLMYDDEYSLEDRKLYEPLSLHNYSIKGPKKLGYSTDMYEQITKIRPDIIHTQSIWTYLSYVNKIYHSKTGTAYIVSPHGMLDSWQLNQSIWKDLKKKVVLALYETKHLQQANCIHALCKSEYDAIRAFGLKNPVAIIPNGTDLPTTVHRDNEYPIAYRWSQQSGRKTLLFLSRIHYKKGLDSLLQAWALTHPHKHDWQLVIAGETKDKKYMQSLVNLTYQLQLTNTIQFIGGQFGLNKQTCYIDADAFILPSFSEGLPLAVLEAWSYSLPTLMTTFCNLPEGFSQKAAIQIDPTPKSIAAGIEKLLTMTEGQLVTMGDNGRKLVEEKFTWEQVARTTMQLYEWILGSGEKPNFVS